MTNPQAQTIMDTHLKTIGGKVDEQYTQKAKARLQEAMRLAQIDMINSHWDNMDEVAQKRALKTLKQIQKVAL